MDEDHRLTMGSIGELSRRINLQIHLNAPCTNVLIFSDDEDVDADSEMEVQTAVLKEKLRLANTQIEKMQREMNHLQQQVTSLSKRCSDLENNEVNADKTHGKEKVIQQLKAEIVSEERTGGDVKFPELEPCPLLMMVGHLPVPLIQRTTQDWLEMKDNWFIRWREWIGDIVNWWGSKDHVPDTDNWDLYQKIREWIRIIRHGLGLYIEYQDGLIRYYEYVKRLPRSTRAVLGWGTLKELNDIICEVRLNKKVLEEAGDEEVSNLESWLYNQTCGRVGVEDTMRKYLVTAADDRVDWLKQLLKLDVAKNQLKKLL